MGNGLPGMGPGAATPSHTTPGAHAPEGQLVCSGLSFSFPHKPHLPEYTPGLPLLSLCADLATLLILWV